MYIIFAILITIASILLVGVILIQKSKGGGLAANVNNYNQFMGVRKTTDFVEKATWGLAIIICILSIASAFVTPHSILEAGPQITTLPTSETQAPNFGTQAEKAAPAAAAPAAAPAPAADKAKPAAAAEKTTTITVNGKDGAKEEKKEGK